MTQRPKGPGDGKHVDSPTQTSKAGAAKAGAAKAGAAKAGATKAGAASPAGLWDDWVTIWQSELNAMASDREMAGAFRRVVGLWADGARAAGAWLPDGAAGRAGAEPPSRATPAAAAPDARDLALDRLARRVEELERRLAGLDGSKSEP